MIVCDFYEPTDKGVKACLMFDRLNPNEANKILYSLYTYLFEETFGHNRFEVIMSYSDDYENCLSITIKNMEEIKEPDFDALICYDATLAYYSYCLREIRKKVIENTQIKEEES